MMITRYGLCSKGEQGKMKENFVKKEEFNHNGHEGHEKERRMGRSKMDFRNHFFLRVL
jgi:hypothetical protein